MLFFKRRGYRISVILWVRALGGQNPTINRYYGKPREKNAQAQSLSPPDLPILQMRQRQKLFLLQSQEQAKLLSRIQATADTSDSHNTAS